MSVAQPPTGEKRQRDSRDDGRRASSYLPWLLTATTIIALGVTIAAFSYANHQRSQVLKQQAWQRRVHASNADMAGGRMFNARHNA